MKNGKHICLVRGGYNLEHKLVREYQRDKQVDIRNNEEELKKFQDEISVYNYDFRHEYAIYKEYEQAMKDGRLEEYHKWLMDLREKEKPIVNENNLKLIENDTKIRESIYKKLTENAPHLFFKGLNNL